MNVVNALFTAVPRLNAPDAPRLSEGFVVVIGVAIAPKELAIVNNPAIAPEPVEELAVALATAVPKFQVNVPCAEAVVGTTRIAAKPVSSKNRLNIQVSSVTMPDR